IGKRIPNRVIAQCRKVCGGTADRGSESSKTLKCGSWGISHDAGGERPDQFERARGLTVDEEIAEADEGVAGEVPAAGLERRAVADEDIVAGAGEGDVAVDAVIRRIFCAAVCI